MAKNQNQLAGSRLCFGLGPITLYGPLNRYVKLRVVHAPGILGTYSPPPTSKETASQRSWHASLIRNKRSRYSLLLQYTVYPKKYAHGFVVLCFVVVMQSFIMNSHEVFIHIHRGCFAGTGAIVRLPQCQ